MTTPPPYEAQPSVRRTKTAHLIATGDDSFHLTARLTDQSFNGQYGDDSADQAATIHDFIIDMDLSGADMTITSLEVSAQSHPYSQCPAILPSCQALLGSSLTSGWRQTVLRTLGGTAGCTHVTTLLIGLAEARTSAFFLRMNEKTPYSPQTRSDGRWTAVGVQTAPSIVGACHVLRKGGPVVLPELTARPPTEERS